MVGQAAVHHAVQAFGLKHEALQAITAVGFVFERNEVVHLAGHGAEAVRDAITTKIATLPEQLGKSLTWDQGTEMAQHAQLRIETGLEIYFCDPRSPWQRGTNENTNGLLRQYFPKGTDMIRYDE